MVTKCLIYHCYPNTLWGHHECCGSLGHDCCWVEEWYTTPLKVSAVIFFVLLMVGLLVMCFGFCAKRVRKQTTSLQQQGGNLGYYSLGQQGFYGQGFYPYNYRNSAPSISVAEY